MSSAATLSLPVELDAAHRRHIVGGEPVVFHCHHYNTFLQRSIQDAAYVDSRPFLIGGAAEVAHAQLSALFAQQGLDDIESRKELASEAYRWAGFGTFDLSGLEASGGTVKTTSSHYAWSWTSKFGPAQEPVCYFAMGWLAGASSAIYDEPVGTFSVSEEHCQAAGGDDCTFRLERGTADYGVFSPVGVGPVTDHRPLPIPDSPVDYEGIYGALSSMDISGTQDGQIDAFGVYLTHHFANYYNRISFELLHAAQEQFGSVGREVVEPLLIEAGHVCAFNTFGGIMKSSEWDALIRPTLESQEDWVHGMVAAVNALGWGRWQVTDVGPTGATFVVHDDYESVGHLAMYGKSEHPISYLALGAAMGIMNLVYNGDISSRPELDGALYDRLFKGTRGYQGEQVRTQAMGDAHSEFRVTRA